MVLSSKKNLYQVLEISPEANSSEIKSAYRKLARKFHPDLNSGDHACVKKFKEITEAYEILSDIEKKRNYDILSGFYRSTPRSKYTEANKAYKETTKEEKTSQNVDFTNILNDIIEGFKKTTSTERKADFKTKPQPQRGSDVYTNVKISYLEALQGTTRVVNILHSEVCPNCAGKPFLNGTKCAMCKGLGEQSIHKKLTVKIPANVKNGSKIRIANEGNRPYNGGRNGDLFLNVRIENDAVFKYDGLNILVDVSIAPYEAVLGAMVEVQTPEGPVSMRITPNTVSGQKFRLSGQGAKEGSRAGDIIVTTHIDIPRNLSKEEIELYKKLRDINGK